MADDETKEDPEPPTALRVAQRALILASVACRASIDDSGGEEWAPKLHRDLNAWIPRTGLRDECEEWEAALLEAPLGKLEPKARINASWMSEGMAVLSWALGKSDLPPHDEMVDPKEVADGLGFLKESAGGLLASPLLRSEAELGEMEERMFAVHWRLREYSLTRKPVDLWKIARNPWMGETGVRQLPLIDGDLSIHGARLSDVEEKDWRGCLSIAAERHRAANWLAGFCPVYSDVDTST